jgi:hypothetical protein
METRESEEAQGRLGERPVVIGTPEWLNLRTVRTYQYQMYQHYVCLIAVYARPGG